MFPFNDIVKSLASRHLHRVICVTSRASRHLRRVTCITSRASRHVHLSRQESDQKLAGRTNHSLPYQGWCTLSTRSWSRGYIHSSERLVLPANQGQDSQKVLSVDFVITLR